MVLLGFILMATSAWAEEQRPFPPKECPSEILQHIHLTSEPAKNTAMIAALMESNNLELNDLKEKVKQKKAQRRHLSGSVNEVEIAEVEADLQTLDHDIKQVKAERLCYEKLSLALQVCPLCVNIAAACPQCAIEAARRDRRQVNSEAGTHKQQPPARVGKSVENSPQRSSGASSAEDGPAKHKTFRELIK